MQLVDAVTNACSQICIHLSDSLFDLVLNMIFDYASTNVRPNAVRAVHQLVECVANAHPAKTLAKFVPFCIHNIEVELENGASSTRTTSTFATSLPSDATFHWSMEGLILTPPFTDKSFRSGDFARGHVQVSISVEVRFRTSNRGDSDGKAVRRREFVYDIG